MAKCWVVPCSEMAPDYCSMSAELMVRLGLQFGDQVRVQCRFEGKEDFALYTVTAQTTTMDDKDKVRLNVKDRMDGLGEVVAAAAIEATVQGPIVVNLELGTDHAEAKRRGELIEMYTPSSSSNNKSIICIAPHGGMIDLVSDVQAVFCAKALNSALWMCKGYKTGGGAFARWHVTSNDISPRSFPLLGALGCHEDAATTASRRFDVCLSFHGMRSGGVLIGGLAPLAWKQRLRDLVEDHINAKEGFNLDPVDVRIATADDACNGLSPANVCNWLTKHGTGGIQFEQDCYVREKYYREVANAVVEFARELSQ